MLAHLNDRMAQIAGTQDVDIGKAPRNVSAATAIQLLQEKASERRGAREAELRACFRELYSHQALLLREFVREPRSYLVPGQGGTWEEKQFEGIDLAGQTDIMIDEEAGYDLKAFERESIVQLSNMGLLNKDTPYAKREIARAMGMNPRYMDEENVQLDDAERKWAAFRSKGEVPAVDPTLDDHWKHWQVYGRLLLTEEGTKLATEADWPVVLKLIAGWEAKLAQAQMLSEQVQQLMQLAQTAGPEAQVASMSLQGIAQQTGQPPEAMILPDPTEDAVMQFWLLSMKAKQYQPQSQALPFIAFRAVVEAHRILAQQQSAQVQTPGIVNPIPAPAGQPAGQEGQPPQAPPSQPVQCQPTPGTMPR